MSFGSSYEPPQKYRESYQPKIDIVGEHAMTDNHESVPRELSKQEALEWQQAGSHLEGALTLGDQANEAEVTEWFLNVRRRCIASIAMGDDPTDVVLRLQLGQDPKF